MELLLFQIGPRTFGADAHDVLRVVSCSPDAPGTRLLGENAHQTRALVVALPRGGEAQIPVDRVLGMRRVPLPSLRKMPEFARELVHEAEVGFVLDENDAGHGSAHLLPLIDLRALVKERAKR